MGENSDQIERHIQEQRDELGDNIGELQKKAKNAVDWRNQVQHRPMAMMGIAFAGGVLLSALLPHNRQRSSSRRSSSSGHWTPSGNTEIARPDFARNTESEYHNVGVARKWGSIKGALVGVAATRLGSFLKEMLPGFDEEYRKIEVGKS